MRWVYLPAVAAMVGTVVADVWFTVDYQLLANVAVAAAAVLTSAFAALYAFRSKWWRNPIGKTYLVKSVFMALMLDQIALALWWGADFPGRQHIRWIIYASAVIAYIPMFITLFREQSNDRQEVRDRLTANRMGPGKREGP